MDWVFPPIRHDFWNKNDDLIFFFFLIQPINRPITMHYVDREFPPEWHDFLKKKIEKNYYLFLLFLFV